MSTNVCRLPVEFRAEPSNEDRAREQADREALIQALLAERRSRAWHWELAEQVEDAVLAAKARGRLLRFPTVLNRPLPELFTQEAS